MVAPEQSFEHVLHDFETAHAAYERLGEPALPPPDYISEEEIIPLASIERYKQDYARYAASAHAQAAQHLSAAKAALDAWFPASVTAAFDRGSALVAPTDGGVLVLIRHKDSYLIERGATQEEALNKLERFLNQF